MEQKRLHDVILLAQNRERKLEAEASLSPQDESAVYAPKKKPRPLGRDGFITPPKTEPGLEFVIPVAYEQSVPITVVEHHFFHGPHRQKKMHNANHTRSTFFFDGQWQKLNRYPENIIASIRSASRLKRLQKNIGIQLVIGLAIMVVIGGFSPVLHFASSFEKSLATQAKSGYLELELGKAASKKQNFNDAAIHFARAKTIFDHALSSISKSGQASAVLPYLVDNSSYSTAQALLQIAKDSSQAGIDSANLGQLFEHALHADSMSNQSDDSFAKINAVLSDLLQQSQTMSTVSLSVMNHLSEAERILQSYASRPVANYDLEQARISAWNTIPKLALEASVTHQTIANLPSILGMDRNRRYMILFLNNTELRPGGGFIGSFATFLMTKGQISGFNVQTNIYKLDDAFNKTAHVDAPYPISDLTKDWTMHDANWDTDFHASAEKVRWFYKQEVGEDVDGVFSIDTTFLEQLLKQTGPVVVPNQNITLSSENAVSLLQYKSEKEYLTNPEVNALNEPKKAIADAFPFLLSQSFDVTKQNPQGLLDVFDTSVREKHVMFAPFYPEIESVAVNSHLDSSIPVGDDFLMVNNGNLGGYKSSLHITEQVDVSIQPTDHSTLLHSVTIHRTHTGSHDWPDGDNHNYVRLMVPKNAVYLQSSSTGAEKGVVEAQAYIEQFDQYQTFGHWLSTPVGASTTAHFEYETPIQSSLFRQSHLSFHYLKQPGWTGDDLSVHFKSASHLTFTLPTTEYSLTAREDLLWQIPLQTQ